MKLSRRTLLAAPALVALPPAKKPKLARFEERLRAALDAHPVDTRGVAPKDYVFRQADYPANPARGSRGIWPVRGWNPGRKG